MCTCVFHIDLTANSDVSLNSIYRLGFVAETLCVSCEKLQTRPLVREGAPHQQIRTCPKTIKKNKKNNWSQFPDGCLTPRHTGRLTVGRNITLTLKYNVSNPAPGPPYPWGYPQIWDSKIWSRVLRDSDPRITALASPSSCKPVLSSERAPRVDTPATMKSADISGITRRNTWKTKLMNL
jgi:hypothetical protein